MSLTYRRSDITISLYFGITIAKAERKRKTAMADVDEEIRELCRRVALQQKLHTARGYYRLKVRPRLLLLLGRGDRGPTGGGARSRHIVDVEKETIQ
jgi:hypothetical protein